MTLIRSQDCQVPGNYLNDHVPSLGLATGIQSNTHAGPRRSSRCHFCNTLIFSNWLSGHATREVRFGPWYHEVLIITEWP